MELRQAEAGSKGLISLYRRLKQLSNSDILITKCQTINPLTQQAHQSVITTCPPTFIRQCLRYLGRQSQATIHLTQQQGAAVAADVTTSKIGLNFSSFTAWKFNKLFVTFCHGEVSFIS
jgi:hypothetical protein